MASFLKLYRTTQITVSQLCGLKEWSDYSVDSKDDYKIRTGGRNSSRFNNFHPEDPSSMLIKFEQNISPMSYENWLIQAKEKIWASEDSKKV